MEKAREFQKSIYFCFTTLGFPCGSAGKDSACNAGDPGLAGSAGEGIGYPLQCSWASLMAQLVKNPPAMRETWVQSLDWEDSLDREQLSTLVFWPGEFHGLYSLWSCKELDMTERLSLSLCARMFTSIIQRDYSKIVFASVGYGMCYYCDSGLTCDLAHKSIVV